MASKVCDSCNPYAKTPASVPYAAFETPLARWQDLQTVG